MTKTHTLKNFGILGHFFFCAQVLYIISILLQMKVSLLLFVPRLACYHKHVLCYYTVHHPYFQQLQTSPLIDCTTLC